MKKFTLILGILLCSSIAFTQYGLHTDSIRVYSYAMDPCVHPDYNRFFVKPPDADVFENRIQFMALRSLDGDYIKKINKYTRQYELGNILWPSYTMLYRPDLANVVKEIKDRGLYLFDLWGYVPGSGPGGYWQQFKVPRQALNLFQQQLGNRWLGMDNGEQDGRYIGGYANQMYPVGSGREMQYLNFQHHFQGLCDRLGNKMATLVSLTYGHYFLKEGVYTLIGAETAQGLPNDQIYYSFIRGAGKQYGVPWFGNASVWNRWGWKNYEGKKQNNGGEAKGTSLSLLKRLMYSQIMYNCVAVGFESSFFDKKGQLSPIGKIQQSANRWVKKYGTPGVMYTPVAVMLDFYAGWTFPRHLYTGNVYRVWGNLPYKAGDFLTSNILDMFYPGYQDASYFHDERGFITPTPYGDVADVLLSDSPSWLLKQYSVIMIAGELNGGNELKDKLKDYVRQGGHLIITAGNLQKLPGGVEGVTAGDEIHFSKGEEIIFNHKKVRETSGFSLCKLSLPPETEVIARHGKMPAIVRIRAGKGTISILASPFGVADNPVCDLPVISKTEKPLNNPYPLLNHIKDYLEEVLNQGEIYQTNKDLSVITCRKTKGEYTVALCNNSWKEKSMFLTSKVGDILSVTELPIDCSEKKAVGYLPEVVKGSMGQNGKNKIAGGDIRIFRVKMKEKNIEPLPFICPPGNPKKRGIVLRNITSIKREILLRPTFFQYFDRVVVDWKYFKRRDRQTLQQEAGWIKRQGLKISGDFSSGINLFPDLRLVDNDSLEYGRSISAIYSVLDKMAILGIDEVILTTHRRIENNFSGKQFDKSLIKTLKNICVYAEKYKMSVNLRMTLGKSPDNLKQAADFLKYVDEPNFYIAPATAMLMSDSASVTKNLLLLKNLKLHMLFVSMPGHDIQGKLWNINKPIFGSTDHRTLKQVLMACPGADFILDGIYHDKDEEYLDIKTLKAY